MTSPRVLLAAALLATLALSACGDADPQAAPTTHPPTTSAAPATTPPAVPPTTEPPAPPPAEPKLGATQITMLGKATVYSVKFPVTSPDGITNSLREPDMAFAIADIKVCSNGLTDADGYGFDASDFQLLDTQDSAYTFWNKQVGARSPNLTDSVGFGLDAPRAGSCKRGWLTFELPKGTKVKAVEYTTGGGGLPLVWAVG